MSSRYDLEPSPSATVTLVTTVGPIHISLFARQTPVACKNFLQHCLDGYYTGTTFHRVVPGFLIQGGDPTGTGSGGASIYEDAEFEYDPRTGEKVLFQDEIHSRLRFNRRGLLGMAKSDDGTYGSQFFITLAEAERELNKKCTLFGRLEGDSIYNVMKIAEGDLVDGSERPIYMVKITECRIDDSGPFEDQLKRREKVAVSERTGDESRSKKKKKKKKKKKTKAKSTLLSFGADEEENDAEVMVSKPKFNTNLVRNDQDAATPSIFKSSPQQKPIKASRSPNIERQPREKPELRVPDPNTQLPLRDAEKTSRSPSPTSSTSSRSSSHRRKSLLSKTNAEIASLKASMRRDVVPTTSLSAPKKSALESLIPETAIRGRKRPAASMASTHSTQDTTTLRLFNDFKAKLDKATLTTKSQRQEKQGLETGKNTSAATAPNHSMDIDKIKEGGADEDDDEEDQVCDLHFISNCQSCRQWDLPEDGEGEGDVNGDKSNKPHRQAENDDDNSYDWMGHTLRFGRDQLGKDLSWKQAHRNTDDLVVFDPRQKEKEVVFGEGRNKWEYERKRKMNGRAEREWDRR